MNYLLSMIDMKSSRVMIYMYQVPTNFQSMIETAFDNHHYIYKKKAINIDQLHLCFRINILITNHLHSHTYKS